MVSYIVPLLRPDVYEIMAAANLARQEALYGAQVITVQGADSIYAACEQGRQQAEHSIHVYLHDDVALLDFDVTPRIHEQMNTYGASLMGVIGARGDKLPWWTNDEMVGGWLNLSDPGKKAVWQFGGYWQTCAEDHTGKQRPRDTREHMGGNGNVESFEVDLLDGIVLAERFNEPWPERPGAWHGYDVDRCRQVKAAGGRIVIGDLLVCHWTQHKPDPAHMENHAAIMEELRGE